MRSSQIANLLLSASLMLGGCVTHSATVPFTGPAIQPRYFADSVTERVAVTTAPTITTIDKSIRDIRDARELDAALDGYAAGMAIDSGNVELHREYLRKVVDLDAPKLGESAARQVLAVDPGNGLARAVLADSEARQGLIVDALTDIGLAVRRAPAEPFVQHTAAHLLAWMDNNPQPPTLATSVQTTLQNARTLLEGNPAYVAAYKDATHYFHDEQDRLSRAPQGPTAALATADRTYLNPTLTDRLPDTSGYSGGDIGYSAVSLSRPYAVYNNYYYDAPYACNYPYYYGYGSAFSIGYYGGYGFSHFHYRDRGFRDCYFGHSGGFSDNISYGIGRTWNDGVSGSLGFNDTSFRGSVYGRSGYVGNYYPASNYGQRGYSYGGLRYGGSAGRSWNGRSSGTGGMRGGNLVNRGNGSGGNRGSFGGQRR